MWTILLELMRVFAPLSFLTVGGGQSIIPEIHRQSVEIHNWISNQEFLDLFALSRLTPGPKSLLVTMVGWKTAGWTGALAASIAIFLPSALLIYYLATVWKRYEGTRFIRAVEIGLLPIAAGMILAASGTILKAAEGGPWAWGVALAATALLLRTRINPLLLLALGGALFALIRPLV